MTRGASGCWIWLALALPGASCANESSERACALLNVEECASRPYCAVVTARRLDEQRGCQQPSEPLTCSALERECDDALTLARDSEGQLFWLSNTCIPSGLREEDDSTLYSEASSWPDCE